ncbi:MAG TPA: pectate lyase, partial [Verrucomicrobiae bacterium]|nr:pectate lyase [Verrucomicrobiae bacterium]
MKIYLSALFCGIMLTVSAAPKAPAPVISLNANDGLVYDRDEHGNRVPDFSTCGYVGGDKDIPNAPVQVVVAPMKGDETARIQHALDYVAALPADANGLRGAVLLLKGRHEVLGGLLVTNSGVVLRGQGVDENGTVLVAAGLDRRTLIRVVGRNDRTTKTHGLPIADNYVPVGATSFHLEDASGLKVGDTIRVVRPSTKEWIDRLSANEFGGGEGGGWKPGSRDLAWDRVVTAVESNLVTIDAPIT